jgi:hypothetical protein
VSATLLASTDLIVKIDDVVVRSSSEVLEAAPRRRTKTTPIRGWGRSAFEVTVVGVSSSLRGVEMDDVTLIGGQSWFWSLDWNAGEIRASDEAAAGLGQVFASGEDFLASLSD